MHNFVACFWKGGDFLNLIQFAFIHGRTVKGAESNIFTSKPRSVFKTLGLIRFEVVFYHTRTRKRKIPKVSRANCVTTQLTVRAWSRELEEQCAWTEYYPLSCFSLGSFAGPPGKLDYLENFHPDSQLTGLARLSYNRKVDTQIYAPTASCRI